MTFCAIMTRFLPTMKICRVQLTKPRELLKLYVSTGTAPLNDSFEVIACILMITLVSSRSLLRCVEKMKVQVKLLKVDQLVLVLREFVFAKVFLVGNVFAGICFCVLFKNPRKSRQFFFSCTVYQHYAFL